MDLLLKFLRFPEFLITSRMALAKGLSGYLKFGKTSIFTIKLGYGEV